MDNQKALKVLNPKSVLIPIIIAIGLVIFLLLQDDKLAEDTIAALSSISPLTLVWAIVFLGAKDLLNTFRLRFISGTEFGISSALRVILLWEFAIAVTPPVLGATGVLVFIMFKEGTSFAKALAFTLLLAIFDNLFFVTATPISWLLFGDDFIPDGTIFSDNLDQSVGQLFWLSYSLIVYYTTFMLCAVLIIPQLIRRLVRWFMRLKWLRRWEQQVMKQMDDLVLVSQILRGKKIGFWLGLIALSYIVWILKYSLVNVLVAGSGIQGDMNHVLLLARHLAMWVFMLVSPAPGNAGVAEFIFPTFFEEFTVEKTFAVGLLWRAFSYYPYLVLGAFLLPKWLGKKKGHRSDDLQVE